MTMPNDSSTVGGGKADELPLVVSLSTLPSRIGFMRPTLESLLGQSRRPDKILLCLPERSFREDRTYDLPEWLPEFEPLLRVVRCARDDGPGTKLLGALPHIHEPTCLVVVDDDMRYRPEFLDITYRAQSADHRSSFSFYTFTCGPFMVGQGADGFSFYTPNLAGIERFAARVLKNRQVRHQDDLWISAFLMKKGIAVRSLRHLLPGGGQVYDRSHGVSQLSDLQGDLARNEVNLRGTEFLLESGAMGRRIQLKLWLFKRLCQVRDAVRRVVRR